MAINPLNENLQRLPIPQSRMEKEDGTLINLADWLDVYEKTKVIDEDARRRVTTNIIDVTHPIANADNALVFSWYLDSEAQFISTTDTLVPFYRTDNSNAVTDVVFYMRRIDEASVPTLAETTYFEGGVNRTGYPINSFKSAVEVVPKVVVANVIDGWDGVNGWQRTNYFYNVVAKRTSTDLLDRSKPPLIQIDPSKPVIQLAVVLTTTDPLVTCTAHVHLDAVEVVAI